jgi:hypothetical protein
MIPIVNALKFEKIAEIRKTCLETYAFLLYIFGVKKVPCTDFFKEIMYPCLEARRDGDTHIHLAQIIGCLVTDRNIPESNVFQMLRQPLDVLLHCVKGLFLPKKWTKYETDQLFQYFLELPQNNNKEYCLSVIQVWSAMIQKLQLNWAQNDENLSDFLLTIVGYLQKHLNHPLISQFISSFSEIKVPERTLSTSDVEVCSTLLRGAESILPITVNGSKAQNSLKQFFKVLQDKVPNTQKKSDKRYLHPQPERLTLSSPVQSLSKKEPRLKKQKTEYIHVPMKLKTSPMLSKHQLEKMDSSTHLTMQKMYNTLVPSSQPDIPYSMFT